MGLRKSLSSFAAATGAATLLVAGFSSHANAQQTAYAIGNGGTTLIRFATNSPGAVTSVGNFTLGGVQTYLDGISFRPSTGQLYGYLDSTKTLYTVNTSTGALTAVNTAGITNTNLLGLGFNPVTNSAQIVTDSAQLVSYSANTSTAPSQVSLSYAASDPNANAPLGARIIDNAFSNSFAGATSTVEYGIDYGTSSLVTIAADGTLNTIGALGVILTPNVNSPQAPYAGFDIFSALGGGTNTALAVLDTTSAGSAPSLYSVNLSTGAASLIGAVSGTQVYGLAVTSQASAPEPGALALLAPVALPIAGGIARRRRHARI